MLTFTAILLVLGYLILTILVIYDIITSINEKYSHKVVWVLAIIFIPYGVFIRIIWRLFTKGN